MLIRAHRFTHARARHAPEGAFSAVEPDLKTACGSMEPARRRFFRLLHNASLSAAGVRCGLHDLRHTFCTMLALMGHMSRAMLERYSHIRMAAKREAVATVTLRPVAPNSKLVPVKVPVVVAQAPIQ